jgi:hypothetical protein
MFIIKKEEEKLVGDEVDNPPSQWRSDENNSNECV